MGDRKTYFSLQQATQVERAHAKDLQPPGLVKMRDFYLSPGDNIPTARPSLVLASSPGATLANSIGAAVVSDSLHEIVVTGKNQVKLHLTEIGPMNAGAATPEILSHAYTTGTVTTDGSTSTVYGTDTLFLQSVWPGCLLLITGQSTYYRVTSVGSQTSLTVDGVPASATGATYRIFRTHDQERADFPLHVERYLHNAVYNSTDPTSPTAPARLSGPFYTLGDDEGEVWQNIVAGAFGTAQFSISPVGIASATVGDEEVIAVAYTASPGGGVLVSRDGGASWSFAVTTLQELYSIVRWSGRFWAFGDNNTAVCSTDGIEWATATAGLGGLLSKDGTACAAAENLVIGGTNFAYYNGTSWAEVANPGTAPVLQMAYGGGIALALSVNGAMASTDDGLTWLVVETFAPAWSDILDLVYEDGQFYGLFSNGVTTCPGVSSNGRLWQYYPSLPLGSAAIAKGSANWLAVTATLSGGHVSVSDNGKEWTTAQFTALPLGPSERCLRWTGTKFVGADPAVLWVSDGVTFPGNIVHGEPLRDIAWFSGIFKWVAAGSKGDAANGAIYTVSTTKAITAQTSGIAADIYGIAGSGSLAVAVADGGLISTSPDAVTWTARTSGTANDLRGVAWGASLFVTVGEAGTILTSPDGVTWTARTSGTAELLVRVRFLNSVFIATGENGTLLTSPDGITWTARTSGTSLTIEDVAWDGTKYAAVVAGGVITSTGLVTWTYADVGDASPNLRSILALSSVFYALQDVGTVWTSSDHGSTWTAHEGETVYDATKIATDGTSVVGVALDAAEAILWYTGGAAAEVFKPVSEKYRSAVFTICDGVLFLFGTREWESDHWVSYKRRMRASAPGTVNDFDTDGQAVFADLPGDLSFCDARAVGPHVLVWETSRLCRLSQTGVNDAPYEYHEVKRDVVLASNPVVVDDFAYFIAKDGLLYAATANAVTAVPSAFDATKFDDFNAADPLWLRYDETTHALVVFERGGDRTISIVNPVTGTMAQWTLPQLAAGESDSLEPRSIVAAEPGSDIESTLFVGYGYNAGSPQELITGRYAFGTTLNGLDTLVSDAIYQPQIETGDVRVADEGDEVSVKRLLVQTYSDAGTQPDLSVAVRAAEDDAFPEPQGAEGTIEVTTSTCGGTGTAWSEVIGTGDGADAVFPTQCRAKGARVFIDGVETENASVSDYRELTFSAGNEPALGEVVSTKWRGDPAVVMQTDHFIEDEDGVHHRVVTITDAWSLALSEYAASTQAGKHRLGYQIDRDATTGEGEVTCGVGLRVDQIHARFTLCIRDEVVASPTTIKLKGFTVGWEPAGEEQDEED